jgi:glycosyltransferase involved in cell wall biosynthesis
MTELDVTVVIPVHDREAALHAALRSVLAQTVRPARIVVVDDGSSDGSAAVAEEYPVTLVRHERARGSGAARNSGIAVADTTWIAFLDSDDVWLPEHLATAAPALGEHVFVTTPMVDSFGRGRGNVTGRTQPVTPATLFFPENIVCTSTVVARRSSIDAVGGFGDLPRAQDLDLFLKLLEVGTAVALPVPTAIYTVPQAYQEEGLRARSTAGADQVRARYADREWMTPDLVRSIETQRAWDDLRYAQHRGDARGVLHGLGRLGVGPRTAAVLQRTLVHRRRARRFTAPDPA